MGLSNKARGDVRLFHPHDGQELSKLLDAGKKSWWRQPLFRELEREDRVRLGQVNRKHSRLCVTLNLLWDTPTRWIYSTRQNCVRGAGETLSVSGSTIRSRLTLPWF